MKANGTTQGDYIPVPTSLNIQSDEDESLKKCLEDGVGGVKGEKENGTVKDAAPEEEKKGPMSPLRKFCFVLSLLQCVLFVIAFGYLIPCLTPKFISTHPQPWHYQLKDTEVVSNFGYAKERDLNGVLIFGYQSPENESHRGLIALNAFEGGKLWEVTLLNNVPNYIYCDENMRKANNGPIYCLVKGQYLDAVNFKNGESLWTMHDSRVLSPDHLSDPVLGQDCNNDSVSEIIVTGLTPTNPPSVVLYVVDGDNGKIRNQINLTHCSTAPSHLLVGSFGANNTLNLAIVCTDQSGIEQALSFPVHNLCVQEQQSTVLLSTLDVSYLHSLPKGDKFVDVRVFYTNHLVLTSQTGHIKRASLTNENAWEINLPLGTTYRDMTNGMFVNATTQSMAVLYENQDKNSTILLIDLALGQIMKNISYAEHRATFLYTAETGVNETDALIIRNMPHKHITMSEGTVKKESPLETTTNAPVDNSTLIQHIPAFDGENFFVLDCKGADANMTAGVNISFVPIWQLPKSLACYGETCDSKINSRDSVVIGDFNSGGKSYFIHAFPIFDETTKKVIHEFRMENSLYYLPEKTCKTCGCR